MTHPIDQANYEMLTQSCPACGSMNCRFGLSGGGTCLDCDYQEDASGNVVNPGKSKQQGSEATEPASRSEPSKG